MKWVIFISCLFSLSFTESKNLYRTYRDVDEPNTIKRAAEVGEHLPDIAIVVIAQILEKASFEEVAKVVEDIVALAKKCAADEDSDPECKKTLDTAVFDVICHEGAIADKCGVTHCCAQTDPERHTCFLAHKKEPKGFIPPFEDPEPEDACKRFHDNKQDFLKQYLYHVGGKFPFTNIVTILAGEDDYEKLMTACCQAEDKPACFQEKGTEAKKKFMKAVATQRHHCSILKTFGVGILQGYKIAGMVKKFPKAGFLTIMHLSDHLGHIYTKCCKGDTLDCMLYREKLTRHICSHQGEISSKLGACCEKPILERGECIAHAENDNKPADLPESVSEFFYNEAVCQHYAENKGVHLARGLYAYARIHTEVPDVLCLRFVKGYEELLEKCCETDHKVACLQEGEAQLKKHIADSKAAIEAKCAKFKTVGDFFFQNELIVLYGKKAPQLSTEQLRFFTKKATDVANKCCHLDDAHRFSCAVMNGDLLLAYLCNIHNEHPINKQVGKCCTIHYPKRQECFRGLGVDPEYVPGPFKRELLTFHSDYCDTQDVQKERQQIVLAELIHAKPTITDEQLEDRITDFCHVQAQCCGAENKDECFKKETPELIKRSEVALGEA